MIDGYTIFLNNFNITEDEFIDFGISGIIWPSIEKIDEEWLKLKNKINNHEELTIRKYAQDKVKAADFNKIIEAIFDCHIYSDGTGNNKPQKMIERLTGYVRNKTIFNYQVSHIFGMTKNPYLFECPWNVLLIPKMFDPLTGHESIGNLTEKFKKTLQSEVVTRYHKYIEDYNKEMENVAEKRDNIIETWDINSKMKSEIEKNICPIKF